MRPRMAVAETHFPRDAGGRILTDSENAEAWQRARWPASSAADLAHRPSRAHEVDLSDAMAGPFGADCARDRVCQSIVEIGRVETAVASQQAAQIGFVECEQTRAELTFGGEAHPVAVIAERR